VTKCNKNDNWLSQERQGEEVGATKAHPKNYKNSYRQAIVKTTGTIYNFLSFNLLSMS